MKAIKPTKPIKSRYMIQDCSCVSNLLYDSDISILSLSPICENISPVDHEYGPPNPSNIINACNVGQIILIIAKSTPHALIAIIRFVVNAIMDYQMISSHDNLYKIYFEI